MKDFPYNHGVYQQKRKGEIPAGGGGVAGGDLTIRASSPEEACPYRAHAASHARTTRTRNETETDFPVGVTAVIIPP